MAQKQIQLPRTVQAQLSQFPVAFLTLTCHLQTKGAEAFLTTQDQVKSVAFTEIVQQEIEIRR